MSEEKRLIRVSKYLSKQLRHTPEAIGLILQAGGWVSVDALLAACQSHNFPISEDELAEVVAWNPKQRFAFDEAGTRIRANQGHSVEVDLQLAPTPPPEVLYHGTSVSAMDSIRRYGISKMSRHDVHLSADIDTAIAVGKRHGSPIVLHVDAARMAADGFLFYRSANGVWLTDSVPAVYLLN